MLSSAITAGGGTPVIDLEEDFDASAHDWPGEGGAGQSGPQQSAAPGERASQTHSTRVGGTFDPLVEEAADAVMQTGVVPLWFDDYAARADRFAQELQQLPPELRDDLYAEILRRDRNALNSWLKPEIFLSLRTEGRITSSELATVAEGFAKAFNEGIVPVHELSAYALSQGNRDALIRISPLDRYAVYYGAASGNPYSQLDYVEGLKGFLKFIGASNGPEVQRFRQDWATHLFNTYVNNLAVTDPLSRASAAAAISVMLGEPASGGNGPAAVMFLRSLTAQEKEIFFRYAMEGGGLFTNASLSGLAAERGLDPTRVGFLRTPFASMLERVANALPSSEVNRADPLLLEMVDFALNHARFFYRNDLASLDHANALARIVSRHGFALFREFGNPTRERAEHHLRTLLELTVHNPDISEDLQTRVDRQIAAYVRHLRLEILDYGVRLGRPDGASDTSQGARLEFFAAAYANSVLDRFERLSVDHEAKRALLRDSLFGLLDLLPLGAVLKDTAGLGNPWLAARMQSDVLKNALNQGNSGSLSEAWLDPLVNAIVGQSPELQTEPVFAFVYDAMLNFSTEFLLLEQGAGEYNRVLGLPWTNPATGARAERITEAQANAALHWYREAQAFREDQPYPSLCINFQQFLDMRLRR